MIPSSRSRTHFQNPIRNSALFLASLLLLLGISSSLAGERTRVTLLSTTDLHGRIDPVDAFTNKPDQLGLAKLATLIRQARKENPELLLLDSGDTIQGSPLEYFHSHRHPDEPDPMMLVMNSLAFDAMTVGNHEFNFGLKVLQKARSEAHFPWLSANTVRTGTDETAFTPFIVKTVSGVRVGVLGITTPAISNWEDPGNFAGLEFRDAVDSAKHWVSVLREKEHVDLVVVTSHMGLEEDLGSSRMAPAQFNGENAVLAIARQVSGVDVILIGHTHRNVPALVVNGVLLSQAGRWGDRLAKVDVTFEKDPFGRWQITSKGATTIPVTEQVKADPEILKLAEPYDRETQAWLSQLIGHCAKPLSAADSRLRDSALIDLVQQAQLEAGNAEVSFAASFNLDARIAEGPVSVRDIYSIYTYENTLVVIEATGSQIKAALEHSARYFMPYEPGRRPADLMDPRIPGYNFDMAEGVSYEIDITRPIGDRILDLRFHGQPIDLDRKFRVAINNYRYNGGGGYTMYKAAPVLSHSSREVRDLIIDWVEKHREIPTEPSNNWHISAGNGAATR
ncbi:MAG: bifunctional UDP-sugar hydrolase/5'-nucleotidase [Opitutaceae bacterium]